MHFFVNSNIVIKGIIQERKDYLNKNLKNRKKWYLTNFIFASTFFHIAFYQIFKNGAILINHGSVFQGKDSL